jgi:hypothetical protein
MEEGEGEWAGGVGRRWDICSCHPMPPPSQ